MDKTIKDIELLANHIVKSSKKVKAISDNFGGLKSNFGDNMKKEIDCEVQKLRIRLDEIHDLFMGFVDEKQMFDEEDVKETNELFDVINK